MISDFVKGKKKYDYPAGILEGIELHRRIDCFTDEHAITREARKIFKSDYGLYSGAFMDIVYDHFLANDISKFSPKELETFSFETYEVLENHSSFHPERFAAVFPAMKRYNWLLNYQFEWGIERSFQGLVYRAKYIDDSNTAFVLFLKHYSALEQLYQQFFPELVEFTERELAIK